MLRITRLKKLQMPARHSDCGWWGPPPHSQWDRKRNLAMRTWRSKGLQWEKKTIVHALIEVLSGASPKHSPHPAMCFPGQLLVCYLQLCSSGFKTLQWRKWDLLCEMRTNCGPFQQFGPHADQVRNCGPLRSHCIPCLACWLCGVEACNCRLISYHDPPSSLVPHRPCFRPPPVLSYNRA